MIQLRGLGETDCDPKTDPVCAAIYGLPTPAQPVKRLYGSGDLINRVLATMPAPTPKQPGLFPSETPTTVIPMATPGWWGSQSFLVKALIIGGGAFVAYKGHQRYVAK